MQDTLRRALVLAGVAAAGLAVLWMMDRKNGTYGLWDFLRGKPAPIFAPEEYTTPTEAALEEGEVPLLARLNDEYARLTAAVVPSVVSIDTSETVAVQSGFPGYYRQYQRPGLGSGVIVTPQGHVITNHHVVVNKDDIRVTRTTMEGRREAFPADLIGSLPSHDIAVLRIRSDRGDFPALKIGDSSKVKVGQLALAIGNPYGLAESVTQGIISAVDRRITDSGPSYFQTDTPINPGNSGGPLVNFLGEIIGINSVVLRGPEADRAAQNIGFAIPSEQAWEAFEIITGRGRQVFGYLGVGLADVTPQIATTLQMPAVQGAWVQSVDSGSPAESAGLRPPEVVRTIDGKGLVRAPDVILSINGDPVQSGEDLINLIRRLAPGTQVRLGVWRERKAIEITVAVGDSNAIPVAPVKPAATGIPSPPPLASLAQGRAILNGVGISPGLPPEGTGVRVEAVRPGSLADGKVKPGDMVLEVNGKSVSSPADFNREVLDAAKTRASLRLKLDRSGEVLEVGLAG